MRSRRSSLDLFWAVAALLSAGGILVVSSRNTVDLTLAVLCAFVSGSWWGKWLYD